MIPPQPTRRRHDHARRRRNQIVTPRCAPLHILLIVLSEWLPAACAPVRCPVAASECLAASRGPLFTHSGEIPRKYRNTHLYRAHTPTERTRTDMRLNRSVTRGGHTCHTFRHISVFRHFGTHSGTRGQKDEGRGQATPATPAKAPELIREAPRIEALGHAPPVRLWFSRRPA